jgi:hypothetical protein
MFIPILPARLFHGPMMSDLSPGSNSSSPADENSNGPSSWLVREREQREGPALLNHLFWTWFVDNPRETLQ